MPAPLSSVLLLASTFLLGSTSAQAPQVVATYTWNDERGVVTSDDVAQEMAPRHRRTPRGEETISHLVDLHLVRKAADAEGMLPSDAEVRTQVAQYRDAIAAEGRDPDQFLASRGVSAAELADYTVLTLALDRLVMRQLGLSDRSKVTNEYRELWLRDARKTAGVVTDEAELPQGIVARAGERQFTMLDLGRVLCTRAKPSERNRFARQIVLRRILEAEAARKGITVTEAECAAAVARIRARAEAERGGTIAFGAMLEAFGTTTDELEASPVLRAQVIARHLLEARHPEAEVERRLREDAEDLSARYGARRHLEVLWLRASETPNRLLPRSFERAAEEAAGLRTELGEGKTFAMLARVHSDDSRTKLKGGDTGWHHRTSRDLPKEVLEWAFAAPQGEVSQPIKVADGMCLVRVAGIEPEPPAALVRARMLDDLEEEFYRELLQQSRLELREGS